jgi:hypothetical protein
MHGDVIIVSTMYNTRLVTDIKDGIPHKARAWDPDFKVWCIDPEHEHDIIDILSRNGFSPAWDNKLHPFMPSSSWKKFGAVDRKGPSKNFFNRKHSSSEDWSILQITESACLEVAQAAYRALCKKYHPDTGNGDPTMIKLVNVAWDRVKQDFEERKEKAQQREARARAYDSTTSS